MKTYLIKSWYSEVNRCRSLRFATQPKQDALSWFITTVPFFLSLSRVSLLGLTFIFALNAAHFFFLVFHLYFSSI